MRHHPRFDVHQHLVIGDVRQTGGEVRIEVRDASGRVHWIAFRFTDQDRAEAHVDTMRRWQQRRTTLTYVRGTHGGALLDDEELFRMAYEPVE